MTKSRRLRAAFLLAGAPLHLRAAGLLGDYRNHGRSEDYYKERQTAAGLPRRNPIYSSMTDLIVTQSVAAIGYSIIYLIIGGGLFGAVVIFCLAKVFRK